MPNYGDAALGLSESWNRNQYEYQEQMQATVGHEEGVSDAHLTDNPEQQHQFRWVDHLGSRARQEISSLLMHGYRFVKNDEWTIREHLWQWDAEDFCVHDGQRLMARPKEKFLEDQARRDGISTTARKDQSADAEMDATPDGLIATDSKGAPIRRKRRS